MECEADCVGWPTGDCVSSQGRLPLAGVIYGKEEESDVIGKPVERKSSFMVPMVKIEVVVLRGADLACRGYNLYR